MDFEDYIAPLRRSAPRDYPDSTATNYLEEVHSLTVFMHVPDIDRAYDRRNSIKHTVHLDLSSLFWSTQSKIHQLNIRLREADHSNEFANQVEHFLCAKCGTWVPNYKFEQHLPLKELIRFCDAPPALSRKVPDSTHHCRIAFQLQDSRDEKTTGLCITFPNLTGPQSAIGAIASSCTLRCPCTRKVQSFAGNQWEPWQSTLVICPCPDSATIQGIHAPTYTM